MKKMKIVQNYKLLIAILLLTPLIWAAGCSKTQRIVEPQIILSENIAPKAVKKAIKEALSQREWIIQKTSPGKMVAQYMIRNHSVTIMVQYNRSEIFISYVDSRNLLYQEQSKVIYIHRNYNRWVNNLKKDIWRLLERY